MQYSTLFEKLEKKGYKLKLSDIRGIKVEHLSSSKGNKIPNQIEITLTLDEKGTIRLFQSYDTIIAAVCYVGIHYPYVFVDFKYNYSTTTSKYRNMFFANTCSYYATTIALEKAIKDGIVKVIDLNN